MNLNLKIAPDSNLRKISDEMYPKSTITTFDITDLPNTYSIYQISITKKKWMQTSYYFMFSTTNKHMNSTIQFYIKILPIATDSTTKTLSTVYYNFQRIILPINIKRAQNS